jgi:hypothetical protein
MFRASLLAGVLAGTTLFVTPASAAALGSTLSLGAPSAAFDASRYDPAASTSEWRCRWNCGWGRGWGRHRGWGGGWRRNRIDGGDVLIGAAIIGGAIAIANSNNRRERNRDVVLVERDRDFRNPERDTRYRDDRRAAPRGTGSSGLDNAVNMCLDRIERDVRVDTVDNVERTASGWQVSGALFNGSSFRCRIGNGGQIDGVDYGEGFAASTVPQADGQWTDQSYADARARVGGTVRPDLAVTEATVEGSQVVPTAPRTAAGTTAMPSYPGGPVPGEAIPETYEEASGG